MIIRPDTAPGTLVFVNITLSDGTDIALPGITTGRVFNDTYNDRATGAIRPTRSVDVITYHNFTADQSPRGIARTFWKTQKQGNNQTHYRNPATDPCPEIDDLTADELWNKVGESSDAIRREGVMRAQNRFVAAAAEAAHGRAVFGEAPTEEPVAIQPTLQPATA